MIIACVHVGDKYPINYVWRLRAAVEKWLPMAHDFVTITDECHYRNFPRSTVAEDDLPTWWAKMRLFDPSWRKGEPVIYFDLDTVIVGDLSDMVVTTFGTPFGICANFTRAAGNLAWPCRYGSCVMTFGEGWGGHVWDAFNADRHGIMARAGRLGDQKAIEELVPDAAILQDRMPAGFFVGYRDLPKHPKPPAGCSVVVFAGNHKPDNTACTWAREAWAA